MRHETKYPTLTPLRAVDLLVDVAKDAGRTRAKDGSTTCAQDRVLNELTDHVKAALVRGGKRKRNG